MGVRGCLHTDWTVGRVTVLKDMWAGGSSASKISEMLGAGITRNAVIGKVHRLKLVKRRKGRASPHRPHPAPAKIKIGKKVSQREIVQAAIATIEEAEPEIIHNIIPVAQRRTMATINIEHCHWPVGDPQHADFFFCGGSAVGGLPYCAHHARVAYQSAAVRGGERRNGTGFKF